MIKKLGFRRVLPFVFTAVHFIALLTTSDLNQQPAAKPIRHTVRLVAAYQEEGPSWPVEPKPLSTPMKIAMLANLPALFLAIPLLALLPYGTGEGLLYAAAFFVPVVWYLIGRWVDVLLGLVRPRFELSRALSGLFALISVGLFVISGMTVTPLNHHRRPDTYWTGAALILWSGLFLAMSLSSYYRRRTTGSRV